MPLLLTPRLLLLPLSREIISRRLVTDNFNLSIDTSQGTQVVHFGPDWPGVRLGLFPQVLRQLEQQGLEADPWDFGVILRETGKAIGQIGAKGPPDPTGAQEIGYGFHSAYWGRGYATEAVGALVEYLLNLPGTDSLLAQTAVTNRASERVLEKLGFTRSGKNQTEKSGELTVWTYRK